MGDFLNSLSGDQKGNLIMQATKIVPAIIGFNQASKAKQQQQGYLDDIKTLEQNRQKVINPYANVTNPYANLQVATKAAEMQGEQTDIALANTLDNLRETFRNISKELGNLPNPLKDMEKGFQFKK